MDVPVYNMQGQEAGTVSIDETALGGVVNPALIQQAYVRYHANLRQGSARNKSRGDLTKTGKKWYKQKAPAGHDTAIARSRLWSAAA